MSTESKILFVAEPRADVVPKSSDGVTFPVRKVSLQANSDVFDGMFDSASKDAGETDKDTGLPLIKLAEKGEDLDVLLRFCVLRQDRSDIQVMSLGKAISLFRLAEKYNFEVVKIVAGAQMERYVAESALEVLAVVLPARQLGPTRAALSKLQHDLKVAHYGNWKDGPHQTADGHVRSGLPRRLSLLPANVFQNVSVKTIQTLISYEEKVLLGEATWPNLAARFTFE